KLLNKTSQVSSPQIKQRVCTARRVQDKRFNKPATNAQMTNRQIKELSNLSAQARKLLNHGARTLNLSPRAYMRTIKVARTIADLAGESGIEELHIAEALQYRQTPTEET